MGTGQRLTVRRRKKAHPEDKGIQCLSRCGDKTKVVDSYPGDNEVIRTRECPNCGSRFITTEKKIG